MMVVIDVERFMEALFDELQRTGEITFSYIEYLIYRIAQPIAKADNYTAPTCPYCGLEMEYVQGNNHDYLRGHYTCMGCFAQAPDAPTKSAAYANAMRRVDK